MGLLSHVEKKIFIKIRNLITYRYFAGKEEERLTKEKEEGKSDKKKKRPRKTKPAGAATAGKSSSFSVCGMTMFGVEVNKAVFYSIGEAVEKVLREKKISNKLNYDVLKSLNVDDFVKSINFGSFAQKDELVLLIIAVLFDFFDENHFIYFS